MTKPRTGQAPHWPITREEFHERFQQKFYDPALEKEKDAIARIENIAWEGYVEDRKAPRTARTGPGFADPSYELSVEWRETHDSLLKAEAAQKDPATRSRVLIVLLAQ